MSNISFYMTYFGIDIDKIWTLMHARGGFENISSSRGLLLHFGSFPVVAKNFYVIDTSYFIIVLWVLSVFLILFNVFLFSLAVHSTFSTRRPSK